MPTQQQVARARTALDAVWNDPVARTGRFGNALRSVDVRGVRGLSAKVEFDWPVVAIGGTNGSGKTTLLQASSAAYSRENTTTRHYPLGRWFRPALARETPPVSDDALISYGYWDLGGSIDVPYKKDETRWRYPRRGNPEREHVRFVGIADFAPKIEQKDRAYHNRARLEVRQTLQLDNQVNQNVAEVLGRPYIGAQAHTVSATGATWSTEILQLNQQGISVTEANMGAGEQKILRLARQLESLPERSLVLLEEPEITLHPDAQLGLAVYLMGLARRHGHQILIATHSQHIFEALPPRARLLLIRDGLGTQVLSGVSHLRAAIALSPSARTNRDILLVEDDVAARFLRELLGRFNRQLANSSTIVAIGSKDDVGRMTRHFRAQGMRCVGVRDPDTGADPQNGLLSLPGTTSIEEILLEGANLQRTEVLLSGVIAAEGRARVRARDLTGAAAAKRTFEALCEELGAEEDALADRLTLGWLASDENNRAGRELVQRVEGLLDAIGD